MTQTITTYNVCSDIRTTPKLEQPGNRTSDRRWEVYEGTAKVGRRGPDAPNQRPWSYGPITKKVSLSRRSIGGNASEQKQKQMPTIAL
jgi:hypothetical protein